MISIIEFNIPFTYLFFMQAMNNQKFHTNIHFILHINKFLF